MKKKLMKKNNQTIKIKKKTTKDKEKVNIKNNELISRKKQSQKTGWWSE